MAEASAQVAKLKESWPVLLALVIVIVAVVMLRQQQGSSGYTVIPADNTAANANVAIASSNAATAGAYQSSIAGEFGSLAGVASGYYQNLFMSKTVTSVAQSQADAQKYVAQQNAAAQAAVAAQQTAAAQAQAKSNTQQSFWNGLFGAVGAIAGLFGL